MWYVLITIFVYSLILTIVTIYKDNSGYYIVGVADIIVAGPVCWFLILLLYLFKPIIKPIMKNHKPKPYVPKSDKYIQNVVKKIIKNYRKHRKYMEYFDFTYRQGEYNCNDIEGWGRLIIKKSYYDGLNKKYESLMYNQRNDILPILLSYFKEFTENDANADTPYEVLSQVKNGKVIYILKVNI